MIKITNTGIKTKIEQDGVELKKVRSFTITQTGGELPELHLTFVDFDMELFCDCPDIKTSMTRGKPVDGVADVTAIDDDYTRWCQVKA